MLPVLAGVDVVPVQLPSPLACPGDSQRTTISPFDDAFEQKWDGGAGTVTTGWLSVANFHALVASIETGALGTSATLDAKLQQALDSSGTSAKDITGKAITQLTQAGGGSAKQARLQRSRCLSRTPSSICE